MTTESLKRGKEIEEDLQELKLFIDELDKYNDYCTFRLRFGVNSNIGSTERWIPKKFY